MKPEPLYKPYEQPQAAGPYYQRRDPPGNEFQEPPQEPYPYACNNARPPEMHKATFRHNDDAARDLLKLYTHPNSQHGGSETEKLSNFQISCENKCRALRLSPQCALENMRALFKGDAETFHTERSSREARSAQEFFEMMRQELHGAGKRKLYRKEWSQLSLSKFQATGESLTVALRKLVRRGKDLQKVLEPRCQQDAALKDMLERATQSEHFLKLMNVDSSEKTSTGCINDLLDATLACETIPAANPTQHARSIDILPPAAFAQEFYGKDPARRANADAFDRRHHTGSNPLNGAPPNARSKPGQQSRRANPIDRRAGEIGKCRECGSPYHYARFCDKKLPVSCAALLNWQQL